MTELFIRIGAVLFVLSLIGAALGVFMALLIAPKQEQPQDEQDDERSQRRRC